jgi:erythromycin esterase
MKILKVVKRIFIVLFCLIFVLVLGYSGTLLFENIQAHQKIANIEKSIQPIDALKINPKAQLVSIGEAAQARFAKEGKYFLDFSATTDQNSKIYQLIHSPMRMGDVGEGYMWLMRLFPNQSSRIKVKPSQMFDSMIFVYKAKPIQIF